MSIAIEAFARALRQIPAIIADNGGYDSTDLLTTLRSMHYKGKKNNGFKYDERNSWRCHGNENIRITQSQKEFC